MNTFVSVIVGVLVSIAAFAGPTAWADDAETEIRAVLPDSLNCRVVGDAPAGVAPEFTLRNLRVGTVESSLIDQNSFFQNFTWTVVVLEFSNQCDNMYSIFFPGLRMLKFGRGESSSLTGSLHFSLQGYGSEGAVIVSCERR